MVAVRADRRRHLGHVARPRPAWPTPGTIRSLRPLNFTGPATRSDGMGGRAPVHPATPAPLCEASPGQGGYGVPAPATASSARPADSADAAAHGGLRLLGRL